jgi:hypothetical protein
VLGCRRLEGLGLENEGHLRGLIQPAGYPLGAGLRTSSPPVYGPGACVDAVTASDRRQLLCAVY